MKYFLALLLSFAWASADAQNYWTSINGDVDSIASVPHVARSIGRIDTRYTVDSVVNPSALNTIPASAAMTANGTVFIGGYSGIYRFTSRFSAATIVLPRRAARLTALGQRVFAATDSGLYITSDDGNSWFRATFFGSQSMHFVANDGARVFAVTDSDVYRSVDNGQTWDSIELPVIRQRIYFLGGACGLLVFQVGSSVFGSTDGGNTLVDEGLRYSNATDVICDDSLRYTFDNSFLAYATTSDSLRLIDTNYAVSLGAYDADHHVIIGMLYPDIRRSSDRAVTWEHLASNYSDRAQSIVARPGSVWIAREHSAIVSTDGGTTWLPAGPLLRVDSIAHYDTVWKYDTTYTTDTLRTHTLMTNRAVRGMVVVHGNELVCATDIGIVRSSDRGAHWILANSGLGDSNLIAIASNSSVMYTTSPRTLYRSTDFGYHWDSLAKGWTTQSITCLAAAPNYLVVGTTSGIYRTVSNGGSWVGLESASLGSWYFRGATLAPWGTLFCWTDAALLRSTNAGTSFDGLAGQMRSITNVFANAGVVAYSHDLQYASASADNGDSWRDFVNGDQFFHVGITPHGALLVQGKVFVRLDSIADKGKRFTDPWRGRFTDFAFDSSDGQYASLEKNGVLYHHDEPASVRWLDASDEIDVSPNPSTGIVSIGASSNSIRSVVVLNLLGQELVRVENVGRDARPTRADLSALPSGTYFLRIETERGIIVRKVVRE